MIFHGNYVDEDIIDLEEVPMELDKCMEEIHGVGACFLCNLEKYRNYVVEVLIDESYSF